MSHPNPAHDPENVRKSDFKSSPKGKALKKAKKESLIGRLNRSIEESKKARSGNWKDLLGKGK